MTNPLHLNNPTLFKTACFIDGNWMLAKSGAVIAVHNPFNGDFLGNVPDLSAEEVAHSVTAATNAQKGWAKLTAAARGKILDKWADLIDANLDDLARILTLEQGKPLAEAKGEINYANSYIRWYAEEGKRVYGDVIPAPNPALRYTILKQPIGVCAAITPWNFPSAMIARKVAPALAAGCAMIVKPDTQTPFSALALMELARQAGVPEGVLQVVTGDAATVGSVLTSDTRVHKLSFTGSTAVGKLLMSQCADTVKKLSLELGGNAPFIIFDDADLDKAIDGLMVSKYRNAGQTCVCANRIYVQKGIKDEFLKRFAKKLNSLTVGNGLDEGVTIGPLINDKALEKVQGLLQDALGKGATLIAGGDKNPVSKLAFNPTIITDITPDMDIFSQEIFGPIAPVFVFDTEEEVLKLANDTIYGLAAYFYTKDLGRSWRVSEGLEYGMVAQNTGLLSTEVAPFGGVKQSGFGREGSKYGIEDYITIKYWCADVS